MVAVLAAQQLQVRVMLVVTELPLRQAAVAVRVLLVAMA